MPRPVTIDREKLRTAIRKLDRERIFYMLDNAIDLLPPAKLSKICKKYLNTDRLQPDSNNGTKATLLADVMAFDKASQAGEFYESFRVNSKNYTEKSTGTTAWIAKCCRLLDRCVIEEKKGPPVEVRAAFDILFGLLDSINGGDEVIFFADEGGSWQVPVYWDKVLPPWFKVLSATAAPEEYAERIIALLDHHCNYERDKMLVVARKTATPEQRKALADIADRQASQRCGGTKP